MKEPIRVLCVMSTLDRGGAENMIMNLYREIDRDRVQFDFIEHTQKKCAFEEEILNLGGRIYRAPRFHIYNYFSYKEWWMNHFKNHPEHQIVHGHFFTISKIYLNFAKKCGRVTIGHSHSAKMSWIKKVIAKKLGDICDYRLACSQDAGKVLYPQKDFIVLKNAINSTKFSFSKEKSILKRRELGFEEAFVIGAVGNLFQVKNPMGILDIFKCIHCMNSKARLVWVGDGDLRMKIEKKIKEYNLDDAVVLTGTRSDVDELLSAMDIYLMPSFFEGLPVALIEAQAAGLPCFCSEAITRDADITGLCHFLPLNPVTAWSDAILNTDISKREDTSQKIKDAGYDIKTTSQWLENFYLDIINKRV